MGNVGLLGFHGETMLWMRVLMIFKKVAGGEGSKEFF